MGGPGSNPVPSSGEPSELPSGAKSPTTVVARARNGKFESTPLQRRVVQTSGSPAAERGAWLLGEKPGCVSGGMRKSGLRGHGPPQRRAGEQPGRVKRRQRRVGVVHVY